MPNEKRIILSVDNLCLRLLETKTDIDYGSFDIEGDDFVIIKGSNGSGKSTFLKLFAPTKLTGYCGLVRGKMFYRDAGLGDSDIFSRGYDRAKLLRRIVNITQEERFSSWASAYTAMLEPATVAVKEDTTLSAKQKAEKIARAKELVRYYYEEVLRKSGAFTTGPFAFRYKKATSFSGGQQKMLNLLSGIIKAEVIEARLILMDEPLNNLDAKNKAIFSAMITALRRRRREEGNPIAIMAITHCQIFEGINKVITIIPSPDKKLNKALCETRLETPHSECLEDFKIKL